MKGLTNWWSETPKVEQIFAVSKDVPLKLANKIAKEYFVKRGYFKSGVTRITKDYEYLGTMLNHSENWYYYSLLWD